MYSYVETKRFLETLYIALIFNVHVHYCYCSFQCIMRSFVSNKFYFNIRFSHLKFYQLTIKPSSCFKRHTQPYVVYVVSHFICVSSSSSIIIISNSRMTAIPSFVRFPDCVSYHFILLSLHSYIRCEREGRSAKLSINYVNY